MHSSALIVMVCQLRILKHNTPRIGTEVLHPGLGRRTLRVSGHDDRWFLEV